MQILEQGPRNLVVLLNAAEVIDVATLPVSETLGSVKGLSVDEVWYDVGAVTDAALQWVATANQTFLTFSGREHFCFEGFGGVGIPNPAPAGATGSIAVTGTGAFTIILKLHKTY